MAKVKGDSVIVEILDGSTWKLYGCATACTYETSTSMLETAEPGSGLWGTFVPGKNSGSGSLEGFTTFNFSGGYTLKALRQAQAAQSLFQMRFVRDDNNGNTYTDTGYFYITNISDSGATDSVASFNVSIQLTGEPTIS
jgi:hypothetical protein